MFSKINKNDSAAPKPTDTLVKLQKKRLRVKKSRSAKSFATSLMRAVEIAPAGMPKMMESERKALKVPKSSIESRCPRPICSR